MTYSLITGIQKIKLAGAEKRAFARWGNLYAKSAKMMYNPPMFIKINSVISFTFVIGCFLAAVGSMLYFSNYTSVIPTSGAMPGLKAFVAAVFGGIGSIPGAVIGAFIIGICENIIRSFGQDWTVFSDAFTFVLLIVVLLVKPTGIFGEKATDKV